MTAREDFPKFDDLKESASLSESAFEKCPSIIFLRFCSSGPTSHRSDVARSRTFGDIARASFACRGCVVVELQKLSRRRFFFGLGLHLIVVLLAVDCCAFAENKLVAGFQLSITCGASEALHVENFLLGPHDEVIFAERTCTFMALGAEQPDVVLFAVRFTFSHEASAALV